MGTSCTGLLSTHDEKVYHALTQKYKTMSLRVEEIESFSKIIKMEDEWNELLKTSGEDTFFLSMPWLKAWWETFGADYSLKCLVVSEKNNVVGIAPFAIASRGILIPWRKLMLIGSGPSDRCGIIAENGRADVHEKIWKYVLTMKGWDVAELRDVCSAGPTCKNFMRMFPAAESLDVRSPYIDVSQGYQEYVSSLSRNMRYNLGRYKRKIEAGGGSFEYVDAGGCCNGIDMLEELSNARWEGDNVLKLPKMVEFAERISHIKTPSSNAVFSSIVFDEKPIAIAMGFIDKKRYMYYLSGFDPQYSKLSPGYVLISEIIRKCCEGDIQEIDMLRGTEGYKYRFNAVDRIQNVTRIVNSGRIRQVEFKMREGKLA